MYNIAMYLHPEFCLLCSISAMQVRKKGPPVFHKKIKLKKQCTEINVIFIFTQAECKQRYKNK